MVSIGRHTVKGFLRRRSEREVDEDVGDVVGLESASAMLDVTTRIGRLIAGHGMMPARQSVCY